MPRPDLAVTRLEDRATPAAVGTPDPTFDGDGQAVFDLGPADVFRAVAVQSDGRVLVAGSTGAGGATGSDFLVARLNANGTLDATFNAGGVRFVHLGGEDTATALVVQPDGRIVVAGYTETGSGVDFAVARLNADGTDDTSFGTNGQRVIDLRGVSGADRAYAVALNAVGGVYVAGTTTGSVAALGSMDMAVVRLDTFGALDKAFGTDGVKLVNLGGTEEARAVAVLSNGAVVLSGFTNAAGTNDFAAVRLSADGQAADFGFGNVTLAGTKAAVIDLGGDDRALATVVQPDAKLVLAGTDGSDFAAVRLDAAGALDTTFNATGTRTVANTDAARAVALQPDGRLVLVGEGLGDFVVARLNADGTDDASFGTPRAVDFSGDDGALAVALDPAGRVVVAGQSGVTSAVARLVGTSGLPTTLLTSGTSDGSGRTFVPSGGQYVEGPAFTVFPGFTGTIRVASGDVTGDGVADRIAGTGPGNAPLVAVYDGRSGALVTSFLAFEQTFAGGVLVASGDFNGDGRAEVVVAADVGGGPRVRVLDGAALATNTLTSVADFLGIADPNFRGGARPSVGDLNGDGVPELIVGAGPGGGPRVAVFDGRQVNVPAPVRLVNDFFAYEPGLRNGAFPAAGDVDGDGFADLVFGAGPGGAPRVRVVGGAQLLAAGAFTSIDDVPGLDLASFFAGAPEARGGVTVTTRDADGDGLADVVTGSGAGLRSEVRLYRGATVLANPGGPLPDQIIDPYTADLAAGVFVG